MRAPILIALIALVGCTSSPAVSPSQPGASTLPRAAAVGASPMGGRRDSGEPDGDGQGHNLLGSWAQYWAPDPDGMADTRRYVFLADGRFAWRAPGRASLRSGRYSLHGGSLVLTVEHAEGEGGPLGERRVELGDCPANDEARALDTDYRCLGFDGDAFWRRGDADDSTLTDVLARP